jgi:hypothetical protein
MRDNICTVCLQQRPCETALSDLTPICYTCAFATNTATTHDDDPYDPATDHGEYTSR